MQGFLDINAVSNLTGYSVEDIRHLVGNKQIPHIAWPDGRVIFPTVDIEKWIKTHKPQRPAGTPKAAAAWPDDAPPPAAPAKDEDPAGPPAKAAKPKEPRQPKAPKGAKK